MPEVPAAANAAGLFIADVPKFLNPCIGPSEKVDLNASKFVGLPPTSPKFEIALSEKVFK